MIVLLKSKSGKLSENSRIPWRGDAALGDVGVGGEDLSGGYFDAGDFMKFNFPLTWSLTNLGKLFVKLSKLK